MQNEQEKLVQLSQNEDDGFSSHSHVMAKDSHPISSSAYEIPQSYNLDRICLLPVNATTLHAYWEITPTLLHSKGLSQQEHLHFILKNDSDEEIIKFQRDEKKAKHYIKIEPIKQKLYLEVGVLKDGVFITLLQSNKISSFNTKIIEPKESDMKWLSKKGGYKEVLYSTMMHFSLGMSSKQYKDQIEFLEKFSNLDIESSFNLAKDKK